MDCDRALPTAPSIRKRSRRIDSVQAAPRGHYDLLLEQLGGSQTEERGDRPDDLGSDKWLLNHHAVFDATRSVLGRAVTGHIDHRQIRIEVPCPPRQSPSIQSLAQTYISDQRGKLTRFLLDQACRLDTAGNRQRRISSGFERFADGQQDQRLILNHKNTLIEFQNAPCLGGDKATAHARLSVA